MVMRFFSCAWTQDEMSGVFVTACGNTFEIMYGTPSENGMRFCPYCGEPLREILWVDEEEAELPDDDKKEVAL